MRHRKSGEMDLSCLASVRRPIIAKELPGNRILAALSSGDIELLRPEELELWRGHVLFDSRSRVDRLYFPHTALVSLATGVRAGYSIETGIIGPEGILGAFAINGDNIALSRAVIQIPGRCGVVSLDRARDAFEKSEQIRGLVGHFEQAFAAQLIQQVACNSVHHVTARCARRILMGLDRTEGDLLPLTHELLGEMLGATRPAVSVALKELERAGIVETCYGRIRVLNRTGLEHASCECYGTIRDTYQRLLPGTYAGRLEVKHRINCG
jgi:CRP-like cAMP-binding protein